MMTQRPPAAMDLPDIIAAAWGVCVRRWRLLVGVAVIGAAASAIAAFALLSVLPKLPEGQDVTNKQLRQWVRAGAPWMALNLAATVFTHLALVRTVLALARGERAGVVEAWRVGLRSLPAALVAAVLLLVAVAMLVSTVFLAPLALFVFVTQLFVPQIVVEDNVGAFTAMRRSWRLVRGQWWRTCAVGLAVLVLWTFPVILLGVAARPFDAELVAVAVAALGFLLSAPFLAAGLTQLYLDVRLRKGDPIPRPAPPEDRPL